MGAIFGTRARARMLAGAGLTVAAAIAATPGVAQAETRSFDLPAQDAARGLPAFATQAGVQIITQPHWCAGRARCPVA